jgi:hypothetical protein
VTGTRGDVAQLCDFPNAAGRLHELDAGDDGVCRTCKSTPSERLTLRRRRFDASVCTLTVQVDTLPDGAPVPIDALAADRYRVEVRAMLTGGPHTGRQGPACATDHDAIEALWELMERERT